jgi:hypothetical protein
MRVQGSRSGEKLDVQEAVLIRVLRFEDIEYMTVCRAAAAAREQPREMSCHVPTYPEVAATRLRLSDAASRPVALETTYPVLCILNKVNVSSCQLMPTLPSQPHS